MIDRPIITVVEAHIARNIVEYFSVLAAVGIAAIVTMPAKIPRSIDDLWTWIRNTLQTATPTARHSQQLQEPQPSKNVEATTP